MSAIARSQAEKAARGKLFNWISTPPKEHYVDGFIDGYNKNSAWRQREADELRSRIRNLEEAGATLAEKLKSREESYLELYNRYADIALKLAFSKLPSFLREGKREEVYDLIDGERDYQDKLASDRTDGSKKTVGDYIVMLQHYQQQAVQAWTANSGTEKSLDVIRKIAGIAVHCMEDHGAPPRVETPAVNIKFNGITNFKNQPDTFIEL